MYAISSIGKKLLEKLRKKAYRHAYLAEHVRQGIAYQIRALRDQRGWNQGKLSAALSKPQSVVCRLEDPGYGKVTVQTLLEVAAAFDVALQIQFIRFSSFIQLTRDVSPVALQVPSFLEDIETMPQRISVVDPKEMLRTTEHHEEDQPVKIHVPKGIEETIVTIQ